MDTAEDITLILAGIERGERDAYDRLLPLVYERLHALAASHFRSQPGAHTLQPTALIGEAYLKMARGGSYRDRNHFFAVAATAMRQILVNHARDKRRLKRGDQNARRVTLSGAIAEPGAAADVLDLHEALAELEQLHARQARIAELRFFGGLTVGETAESLGVSARTVKLDWTMAR